MAREISIIELDSMVKGKVTGSFDEKKRLTGTCAIDSYVENKVSFIRNIKYGKTLAKLRNAVVLLPEDFTELCEKHPQNVYIIVADLLNSLMDVQDFFYKDQFLIAQEGISPTVRIDKSVKTGNKVYIGENVTIAKNVIIGDGVKIFHNSCIFEDVTIGSGTYIGTGVCIHKKCRM